MVLVLVLCREETRITPWKVGMERAIPGMDSDHGVLVDLAQGNTSGTSKMATALSCSPHKKTE